MLLAATLVAVSAPVAAHCNPPCGPIPAFIEVQFEKWKDLTFGDQESLVLNGQVSYYVNIDNDGYWFDPEKKPEITLKVNKQPPWMRGKIEPAQFTVPVDDPQYIGPEPGGSPTDLQFYWSAPIKITISKLRDPTLEELGATSKWVRRDGTVRLITSAESTDSILLPSVTGNFGLQGGYGVRELRFIPEINGVKWIKNPDGAGLIPEDGNFPVNHADGGTAPSPLAPGLLGLLGFVALVYRRRWA